MLKTQGNKFNYKKAFKCTHKVRSIGGAISNNLSKIYK